MAAERDTVIFVTSPGYASSWTHSASSAYDPVAREYYDALSHPTSAALGTGSDLLLAAAVHKLTPPQTVVEVGAGRGFLGRIWQPPATTRAILTDRSQSMLRHAPRHWPQIVMDARQMALATASVDLLLAGLGDPYNDADFWRECSRILRAGGRVLWTTPAYEWASRWRTLSGEPSDAAVFQLQDSSLIAVPSVVQTVDELERAIEAVGMRVDYVRHIAPRALWRVPHKVAAAVAIDDPLVTLIAATRP